MEVFFMKKLFFGLTLAACWISTASAMDYCCPPQYDCDPCCCEYSFNGFYIGGNVGVFSHVARRNDIDGFLTDNSGWSTLNTDFAGGVQGGYDWQCNNRLVGVVADWNAVYTGTKLFDNPNGNSDDDFLKNDIDWYTTIRARAGLAVCDALVYVTAGAAVANFETRWQDIPDNFRHCDTRWGWTGGVGTELFFCRNLTVGAEVLFLHFDDKYKTFRGESEDFYSFGHNDSLWNARLLVNYRL